MKSRARNGDSPPVTHSENKLLRLRETWEGSRGPLSPTKQTQDKPPLAGYNTLTTLGAGLFNRPGAGFLNRRLDQGTAVSLSYVGGSWQIDNPLAFQNEDLDGTWKLTVTDTNRDGVTGTLQAWSMTVTPLAAAASPQSTASAVDRALLAWVDLDSADDDETDLLTESLVDDLALMLV